MSASELYIGLMSGTSLDGIDGVLADFSGSHCVVTHHASAPFAPELRAELMALNTSGTDELHRAALAGNALSRAYAQIVQTLLKRSGQPASSIRAIGAHGQTVRHRPQEFDGTGYTLQLGNPALLAERTGLTQEEIARRVEAMVVTLGAAGSVIHADGQVVTVPAVAPTALRRLKRRRKPWSPDHGQERRQHRHRSPDRQPDPS